MIATDLNRILSYVQNPKVIELGHDFYLDGGTKEEFFWRNAANQNQFEIFKSVIEYDPKFFSKIFDDVVNKNIYSNATYFAIRFLLKLAGKLRLENGNFSELISIADNYIKVIGNKKVEQRQVLWIISEVILEFPLSEITEDHLAFISKKVLDGNSTHVEHSIKKILLPRILEESNKELLTTVVKKVLFAYEHVNNKHHKKYNISELLVRFDLYTLAEIINNQNIIKFIDILGYKELALILIEILEEVAEINSYEFSSLHLRSIEDTDQVLDTASFPYLIVKFLRDLMELSFPPLQFVKSYLLDSNKTILKRIGIHTINYHYLEQKSLFWEWENINPLEITEIKHEVFVLLQNHSESFSEIELDVLFKWIDNIIVTPWKDNQTSEELEISRAILAKEFIAALGNVSNKLKENVVKKKMELDSIHPYESAHPGFNSYSTTTFGGDFPDHHDEFLKQTQTTEMLVDYFKANENNWTMYEAELQSNRLHDRFFQEPKLAENIDKLLELEVIYLNNVIYGLEKAFEDGKEINWNGAFRIINHVIENQNFKQELKTRNSFVGYCGWLIRAGTRDDQNEKGIFEKQLEQAKDICLKMLKFNIKSERLNNDPFFDILNSPEGKIMDATLNVLLRNARLHCKEKADKWYTDVKEFYSDVLRNGEYNDAYIYNISGYLPQFGFLHLEWVKENINFIFPKDNVINWKLAMKCYTRMTSTVYKDIFNILLDNNHYDLGIDLIAGEEDGISDFVQHIVICNIAGWKGQKLEDKQSLINKVIRNLDKKQLIGVVSYLYVNRNCEKDKVLAIWKSILKCKIEGDAKQVVWKEMLKLISRIDNIDDQVFGIILENLEGISNKAELFEMVRYLANSKKIDFENRAKLIILGTTDDMSRYFCNNEIEDMAKRLYKENSPIADRFIENMLEKKLFSVLDIYNKYHN